MTNLEQLTIKLKQDNKSDAEEVKQLEAIRRKTTSEFYKLSYQKEIHVLNARRELRKEILEFLERNNHKWIKKISLK